MCAIVFSKDFTRADRMLDKLAHRGRDASALIATHGGYLGHNRLAIVNLDGGAQPLRYQDGSAVAFNGEIYNYLRLIGAGLVDEPEHRTEVGVIGALMRKHPWDVQRFVDGPFAVAYVREGALFMARDVFGEMPLYYDPKTWEVASERKALEHPVEVLPGETVCVNLTKGTIQGKSRFDPFSLRLAFLEPTRFFDLFLLAVQKRIAHSDVEVCLALSGGMDSACVAMAARLMFPTRTIRAITVAVDLDSDEVLNARLVAEAANLTHVVVEAKMSEAEKAQLEWALEDPRPNPVKWRGAVRNFLVARDAPGKVILSGEGADEIACGYPSHHTRTSFERQVKSLSTLKSMHAINLDRANKCGMAWTKEYRLPFLDNALVEYAMSTERLPEKELIRDLAFRLRVPTEVLNKPKYGPEETALEETRNA